MSKYNKQTLKNIRHKLITNNNYANNIEFDLLDAEESCLGCTEGLNCSSSHKCTRVRNISNMIKYIKTNPYQKQLLKEEKAIHKLKTERSNARRTMPGFRGGKSNKNKNRNRTRSRTKRLSRKNRKSKY